MDKIYKKLECEWETRLRDGYHYKLGIRLQEVLLKRRNTFIANVLLKICITTLLEFHANTHLDNLQNIERILADDYIMKMVLQHI